VFDLDMSTLPDWGNTECFGCYDCCGCCAVDSVYAWSRMRLHVEDRAMPTSSDRQCFYSPTFVFSNYYGLNFSRMGDRLVCFLGAF
jgi:hypothetical protein